MSLPKTTDIVAFLTLHVLILTSPDFQVSANLRMTYEVQTPIGTTIETAIETPIETPITKPMKSCSDLCGIYRLQHSEDVCQCDAACAAAKNCCPDFAESCPLILIYSNA